MAYTKTPEQDTHNKFRLPPRGNQTFVSHTQSADEEAGQRYVNCYPVIRESKTKEPKITLQKAPKLLTKTWVFPDNNAGITDYDFETNIFIHNTRIYKVIPTGVDGPEIRLLNDSESYDLLSCQKVIDYTLVGDIILTGVCRNSIGEYYSYTYNETQDTFAYSTDPIATSGGYYVATDYVEDGYTAGEEGEYAIVRDLVVDGYHIIGLKAIKGGTNRVLISNPPDLNLFYADTDYFTPEIDPDDLVDIQYHKNYICAIGTHTIEFYYNAGNEFGSAFSRQDNYTIRLGAQQNMFSNNGLVSISYGEDIYLIANSENGGNAIYVIRNFQPIKISDDYIDYLLNDSTGLTENTPTSTIRLGVIDVMGTVMFSFEMTDKKTGEVKTFVFNERDMIWWEWKESDGGEFYAATFGPTSNLNGHPFILDSIHLGVEGNVQYTIGKVQDNALVFVVLDEYCPYCEPDVGETLTFRAKFNTASGTPLGDMSLDPPTYTEPNYSVNENFKIYPDKYQDLAVPPTQNFGWLENPIFSIIDHKIFAPYYDPTTTIAARKFCVRAILPVYEFYYAPDEAGIDESFFINMYGYGGDTTNGKISSFTLHLFNKTSSYTIYPFLKIILVGNQTYTFPITTDFPFSDLLTVNDFGFIDATITLYLATSGNTLYVKLTADQGDGVITLLEETVTHTLPDTASGTDDIWEEVGFNPQTTGPYEASVIDKDPNKICSFTLCNYDFTPETRSLPKVELKFTPGLFDSDYSAYVYPSLDSIPYLSNLDFTVEWLGLNYDSYSLDVISGPTTGNLASGLATDTWSGSVSGPVADFSSIFTEVGTYVVRLTVTNTVGSDTADFTITFVEPTLKTISLNANIVGAYVNLNAAPYMSNVNPEGIYYLDAGYFCYFYVRSDGIFLMETSGGFFPDPGQFHWLSVDTGSGKTQPVSTDWSSKYQVKFSIVPPKKGTNGYYEFPWNFWVSYGYNLPMMELALDGLRDVESDTFDQWLDISGTKVGKLTGYSDSSLPGQTIPKPTLFSIMVRNKDTLEIVGSGLFTVLMAPPLDQ